MFGNAVESVVEKEENHQIDDVFRCFSILLTSLYIKKKTLKSNFEFSISVNKDWSELGVKHQVMMNQNQ